MAKKKNKDPECPSCGRDENVSIAHECENCGKNVCQECIDDENICSYCKDLMS